MQRSTSMEGSRQQHRGQHRASVYSFDANNLVHSQKHPLWSDPGGGARQWERCSDLPQASAVSMKVAASWSDLRPHVSVKWPEAEGRSCQATGGATLGRHEEPSRYKRCGSAPKAQDLWLYHPEPSGFTVKVGQASERRFPR